MVNQKKKGHLISHEHKKNPFDRQNISKKHLLVTQARDSECECFENCLPLEKCTRTLNGSWNKNMQG